ncbi:MAG: hypothetical protein QOE13_400 [Gaiellaceae bacterium]|jgi:hypothetical protein|nr:hypothetical protein [Gaiellaceae bacterium]
MTVNAALRQALSKTYQSSWRLLVVNSALSLAVALVILATPTLPLGLLLASVAAGPLAAALAHCAVILVRGDEITMADAVEGFRLHWRQGLALGSLFGVGLMVGIVAVTFYVSEPHRVWPLAAAAVYLFGMFSLVILAAWPLLMADQRLGVTGALRSAALELLRRPWRALGLGAALLLVNLAGALTVVPLLTLTVAYTFLATALVVLPVLPEEAA